MPSFGSVAGAVRFAAAAAACCAAQYSSAATVEVGVVDRKQTPIDAVAVYLVPLDDAARSHDPAVPAAAVMEQSENAFVPHMLVVEAGAEVSFPNNDTVSHHVYSFSETKRFQLDLYRGNTHPPQLFDRPGLVVLGCNIHDGMLGYILVVDTRWFAVTDPHGTAAIAGVPEGDYALHIWTPRANPDDLPAAQIVTLSSDKTLQISVQFDGKLRPAHDSHSGSLSWHAY